MGANFRLQDEPTDTFSAADADDLIAASRTGWLLALALDLVLCLALAVVQVR